MYKTAKPASRQALVSLAIASRQDSTLQADTYQPAPINADDVHVVLPYITSFIHCREQADSAHADWLDYVATERWDLADMAFEAWTDWLFCAFTHVN